MEDLDGEQRFLRRQREREDETLVPDGFGRAGIIRFSGETAVGVNPEDDVGLEIAVTPVDVLQVLGGDDGDVDVVGFRRRSSGCGGHGGPETIRA